MITSIILKILPYVPVVKIISKAINIFVEKGKLPINEITELGESLKKLPDDLLMEGITEDNTLAQIEENIAAEYYKKLNEEVEALQEAMIIKYETKMLQLEKQIEDLKRG